MKFRIILGMLCVAALSAAAESVSTDVGWTLSVDTNSGDYTITTNAPAWTTGGSVSSKLSDVKTSDGSDKLGDFRKIEFRAEGAPKQLMSIRIYRKKPVAIFAVTFDEAVAHSPAAFPVLKQLPQNLHEFRYGEDNHLYPIYFKLDNGKSDEQYGGPFALFDDNANALVLSPASNFMCAMVSGDQKSGLSSGLNRTLEGVPAGFTHQTILTIDKGINHTWDVWGQAVTDLYGKIRPANDTDTGLKYIGYWTDNGGHYYYNYELDKGYEGTLLAVKQRLADLGVPIHYVQLDSWWYPKSLNAMVASDSNKPRSKNPRIPESTWNRYGGLLEYTPHPDLFPRGLRYFHDQLGAPFITHSRWIDPESPYRSQYKISGLASVDPAWWEKIASDISSWGVSTYEQDWLNYLYNRSPELINTTTAGNAFMDGMASACANHNLTMQYCMVLPRQLMQGGAKYPNLTTVRVSGDRLNRGKWRDFLYGSRMASSLGVWPWTDVFRSKETSNMLLCNLSAGMVGLADGIGEEDPANIHRTIRGDGVIIKPDVPATPTDATFVAEGKGDRSLIVASTFNRHADSQAVYLFAYAPKIENAPKSWKADLASLDITGQAFAYDYFNGSGHLVERELSQSLQSDAWAYWIVVPVGKSGMAFVGDTSKFITHGKQRVSDIEEKDDSLSATVQFSAADKPAVLAIYAPTAPQVEVKNGSADTLEYDASAKIARVKITPGETASPDGLIQTQVTFKRR